MTGRIVALVAANVLMLGLGAAMLPLLGLARTPQQLLAKLPLAYAVGLVTTGILAAELALAGVPFGWKRLAVVTTVAVALGWRRIERVPYLGLISDRKYARPMYRQKPRSLSTGEIFAATFACACGVWLQCIPARS